MATRGKPVPVSFRLRVRQLAAQEEATVAAIARALRLSRTTVYKYLRRKTCDQD